MIKNNKIFLTVFFVILSCFWTFWYPGVKVATDYHLSSNTGFLSLLPWSFRQFGVADGMGEYTTFTLWSQPLLTLSELMNLISLNSEIQTKLMGAAILFFGFLGIWKLLSYFKVNDLGKSIGSAFFILNSFFLLMFDGGQFSLNLAYITLPFTLLCFMNLLDKDSWKERVKFTFFVLLVSVFDIRILFLLAIIFGTLLFFKGSFKVLPNLFITAVFTFFVLLGFHAYWILPSIFSEAPHLPPTYERVSQVNFLSFSSIGHSILLQQPHWFKNVFGQVGKLSLEFILIPMLVFLSPILRKKDKVLGFWLLIAVLGIFLSKGSQDPFGGIYLWLFGHFPFFSLFRDPVKFYFLTSLSYSVLLGFTVSSISKLKFTILLFSYLLFLISPVYLGWMSGMLSKPLFLDDYKHLASVLRADHKFSRVLWLPSQSSLAFSNLDHPPLEASRLVSKRPFATSGIGTYETLNFLRESPIVGQLLEVSAVGYLAYPYLDERRDDVSTDHVNYYYTFLKQLLEKPWLSDLTSFSKIPLLKVSEVQNQFFITPNLWWIIGSDDIYNEATKSGDLRLAKNSLVFAEEYSGLSNRLKEFDQAKIILNNKTLIDLAASFISENNLIFPAKFLDFQPNKSGWWKRESQDLLSWREFLKNKYGVDNQDFDLGGGWAVGEGNLKLKINSKKLEKGKVLLARVFESTRSGNLSFVQNNKLIGSINTKKEGNNIRWIEIGKLLSNSNLLVESYGDINVINALAILDEKQWQNYLYESEKLKRRIFDFDKKNTTNNHVNITFKQINPTKYRVNIDNLESPTFIVFSENYDPLWKFNDINSLPVYSLLNGFRIEKNGEYIIEYDAQKWVYKGLLISSLTTIILGLLFFKSNKSS